MSEAGHYALDENQEWVGGEARADTTAIPVDIVLGGRCWWSTRGDYTPE